MDRRQPEVVPHTCRTRTEGRHSWVQVHGVCGCCCCCCCCCCFCTLSRHPEGRCTNDAAVPGVGVPLAAGGKYGQGPDGGIHFKGYAVCGSMQVPIKPSCDDTSPSLRVKHIGILDAGVICPAPFLLEYNPCRTNLHQHHVTIVTMFYRSLIT